MWGSAPRPGRGIIPLHPVLWGFAPRDHVFVGSSLLWLCVPIWGYAPSPARAAWRGASFLMEMKLQKKGGDTSQGFWRIKEEGINEH